VYRYVYMNGTSDHRDAHVQYNTGGFSQSIYISIERLCILCLSAALLVYDRRRKKHALNYLKHAKDVRLQLFEPSAVHY
jgi:hypothetical protein